MATSNRMKWPYPNAGQDPWYDSFQSLVEASDASVFAAFENSNLFVFGGGPFTFTGLTGTVTWTDPLYVVSASTNLPQTVTAPLNTVYLRDGEVAYVNVVRNAVAPTSIQLLTATQLPTNDRDSALVIFARFGNVIQFRNGASILNGETKAVFESSAGTVTSVIAGTGLSGGTITTSGTVALLDTAVTPGSYTNVSLTVDAQGRITSATSGTGPTSLSVVAPIQSTGGINPVLSLGTVGVANGGTGFSSYATGDLVYASSSSAMSKLSAAAAGNVLLSGTTPSYGKVGLTTHVTGTLPATNGGTGQSSYVVGDLLYAAGTSTLSTLATAASGNVLLSGTTPSYGKVGLTTHVSGTLAVGNGGTGISSYTTGAILYASSTSAISTLAAAVTGNVLLSGTTPSWGKVALGTAVSGTLGVTNGGTGQSIAPTNGQLLIGNGTGYTRAVLLSGTGVTISNGAGSITVGTNAVSTNTVSTIVTRDASGNFAAGTITATGFSGPLSGNASSATLAATVTVSDDTTTNSTHYPVITTTTVGAATEKVSSTKLSFNPSTGVLSATTFSGSGASLTSIPNSATTATDANTSSAIVARDASGNFSAGTITASLSGTSTNANNVAVTDDTTTNAARYPTFVSGTGNNNIEISTSKLSYNPSTGTLAASVFSGSGASLVSIPQTGVTNLTTDLGNRPTGSATAGQVTYWSGTNSVTGNANLFWDNSNRRLGIGTNAPATILDVQSTGGAIARLTSTSNTVATYPGFQTRHFTGGFGGHPTQYYYAARGTSATPAALASGDFLGALVWYGADATAPTPAFQDGGRINVIASAAPTAGALTTVMTFWTANNAAAAERVRIAANGNFGIGDTNPGEALVVSRSAGTASYVKVASGTNSSLFGHGAGGEAVLGSVSSQPLLLYTNNSEKARIDTSGRFSIGNIANTVSNTYLRTRGDIQLDSGTSLLWGTYYDPAGGGGFKYEGNNYASVLNFNNAGGGFSFQTAPLNTLGAGAAVTALTTRLTVNNTGAVSIPSTGSLAVGSGTWTTSGSDIVLNTNGSNVITLRPGGTGSSNWQVEFNATSGYHRWLGASGAELARLNANGLGLGGVNPAGYKVEAALGTLSTTLNTVLGASRYYAQHASPNTDYLQKFLIRNTAGGNGWATSDWYFERVVDTSQLGSIKFDGATGGIGFCYSRAEKLKVTSSDVNIPTSTLTIGGTSAGNAPIEVRSNGVANLGSISVRPATAGQARYHLFNGGSVAEWMFGQESSTSHDFIFSTKVSSTATNYLHIQTDGKLRPAGNSTQDLGTSVNRWNTIYGVAVNTSDAREKQDITETDLGLEFVEGLRPVKYRMKVGGGVMAPNEDGVEVLTPRPGVRFHYGFIAQEVEAQLAGRDFAGLVHDRENDVYGLRYDEFIAPTVKAVQELSAENKALKRQVADLEELFLQMRGELDALKAGGGN